jgi:hypothetical protein
MPSSLLVTDLLSFILTSREDMVGARGSQSRKLWSVVVRVLQPIVPPNSQCVMTQFRTQLAAKRKVCGKMLGGCVMI